MKSSTCNEEIISNYIPTAEAKFNLSWNSKHEGKNPGMGGK
jgi:hypothetical protein